MAMPAKEEHLGGAVPKYLQEDKGTLTLECRSILRTLTSEEGWHGIDLHLYQGFWYTTPYLNGVLSAQQNFQADPSDILLATTVKVGTMWLKALVFAILNRSHYSANSSDHPLLRNNPHDLVPYIEDKLDHSGFIAPRLFSTHIPFGSLPSSVKSSECKIVYLCRNPKDTFISLWHFNNKLKSPNEEGRENSLEEALDKFCRGVSICGPYWDHVLEYWKASLEMPHNVLFLKYEDIKEQPYEQLRQLASFLGCPFSQLEEEANNNSQVEEIVKLCSLSNLEVNQSKKTSLGMENKWFFRQGKVGDWANYLTQEMIQRLDNITQEKLYGSTLKL